MGNKNSKNRSNSKIKKEKEKSNTGCLAKPPATPDTTDANDKENVTGKDENITKDKDTPQNDTNDTKKEDDTKGNDTNNNEPNTNESTKGNDPKNDENKNNDSIPKEEQTTYDGNENNEMKADDKKKQLGGLSEDLIVPNTEEEPANNDENNNENDNENKSNEQEEKDDENKPNEQDLKNNDENNDENKEEDEKKEDKIEIKSIEIEDKTSYYFSNPHNLNPEYDRDVVSILALSDTLSTHTHEMMEDIPNVDILIHSGNFTQDGTLKQIQDFNEWINLLLKIKKCKYALIIAGNHEVTFDRQYYKILQDANDNNKLQMENGNKNEIPTAEGVPDNNQQEQNEAVIKAMEQEDEEGMDKPEEVTTGKIEDKNDESDMVKKCRHTIKNAIYLEDQGIEILGIKFYGTPWCLLHNEDENGNNPDNYRAFCVGTENEMKTMFDKIPYDVDVMISHYPPYLHGDGKENVGSKKLIEKLYMDVQPSVHIFGHITSCHGVTKQVNMDTMFMNVNCSNEESEMDKKPILFYLQPKLESFF